MVSLRSTILRSTVVTSMSFDLRCYLIRQEQLITLWQAFIPGSIIPYAEVLVPTQKTGNVGGRGALGSLPALGAKFPDAQYMRIISGRLASSPKVTSPFFDGSFQMPHRQAAVHTERATHDEGDRQVAQEALGEQPARFESRPAGRLIAGKLAAP